MITASLKNFRLSPRKVRLVANMVRGKSVDEALYMLQFVTKKATSPLHALVMSAVANAKNNFNIDKAGLIVKEIRVDAGYILKRRMPRARGNSYPINKRTSHILVVLAPAPEKKAKFVKAKVADVAVPAKAKTAKK